MNAVQSFPKFLAVSEGHKWRGGSAQYLQTRGPTREEASCFENGTAGSRCCSEGESRRICVSTSGSEGLHTVYKGA